MDQYRPRDGIGGGRESLGDEIGSLVWNSPQQRTSLDLEREYLRTVHSFSHPRFGFSCYTDAGSPDRAAAPAFERSLDPPDAVDYVSPAERDRLCREDMRSIGLRPAATDLAPPRAAWYPETPALFHNLHPSQTTHVRLAPADGPRPASAPADRRAPAATGHVTAPPVSGHVTTPPAAGAVTSFRRSDAWGTDGADPIASFRTIPVKQFYDLTQLKRSNLRTNDELTPRPTQTDMGSTMIERPFPAEHPYASHQPRLAIFPKFTDNPDDPRTGVRAREQRPLHSEVPSKPHDLVIKAKTKGSGLHHDLQALPADSERQPLQWPGDRFEQLVKGESRPRQTFYPVPPKLVKPNMETRIPERTVSENTADTLRNLERDQWRTHYSREYTGLGPGNAPKLENLEEKKQQLIQNGAMKDELRPLSTRTFDPPRPVEGRISRQIHPRPPAPPGPAPNLNRKPTVTEVEEHRLLHGKEYASLPTAGFDRMVQDHQWRLMEQSMTPEHGLEKLQAVRTSAPAKLSHQAETREPDPVAIRQQTFKDMVQQMEAGDRWRELEQETPADDMTQLRHKYQSLGQGAHKDTPRVFFDHEGRFQEERAGLYKTSYDPGMLRHAMPGGQGENGAMLFDTSQSHEAAWSHPSALNRAISLPNIGGTGNDLMLHEMQKKNQRSKLEPTPIESVSPRVQEGGHLINRESEKGSQFNIDKFLQEYELPKYARHDPAYKTFGRESGLDLGHIRPQCTRVLTPNGTRAVHFSNDVMVAHGYGDQPIHLTSANLNDNDEGYQSGPAEECGPSGAANHLTAPQMSNGGPRVTQRTTGRRLLLPEEARMVSHQLASKSSTFQSTGSFQPTTTTSYSTQFPAALALNYKDDDPRFQWQPGHGSRMPQSRLLDLQHSFSRTDVRRKFHDNFAENNPDLRENIVLGKKHTFSGMNSQTLRG